SGLSNVQTEIEIFSSIRSITEQSLDPQMIMDFGAGSTKIYIVERGILRASHIVNRGAQDITLALSRSLNVSFDEAESIKKEKGIVQGLQNKEVSDISSINLDFIFSETRRVLLEYQKKYNKNIGQVYLSGGGAALKGLRDVAEINLSVPIKIADPFSKVEYPAFLETILQSVGPEFSVAVGLALRKLEQSE
ncbi:MAG: cell division FtsA domain-containing protein, partial [bacterium]